MACQSFHGFVPGSPLTDFFCPDILKYLLFQEHATFTRISSPLLGTSFHTFHLLQASPSYRQVCTSIIAPPEEDHVSFPSGTIQLFHPTNCCLSWNYWFTCLVSFCNYNWLRAKRSYLVFLLPAASSKTHGRVTAQNIFVSKSVNALKVNQRCAYMKAYVRRQFILTWQCTAYQTKSISAYF